ncbi:hypothetical protein HK405_015126 [Cladochytrium tenue]|nr:hypothetical protein HK405_015126 [Cladochytrium tenue]
MKRRQDSQGDGHGEAVGKIQDIQTAMQNILATQAQLASMVNDLKSIASNLQSQPAETATPPHVVPIPQTRSTSAGAGLSRSLSNSDSTGGRVYVDPDEPVATSSESLGNPVPASPSVVRSRDRSLSLLSPTVSIRSMDSPTSGLPRQDDDDDPDFQRLSKMLDTLIVEATTAVEAPSPLDRVSRLLHSSSEEESDDAPLSPSPYSTASAAARTPSRGRGWYTLHDRVDRLRARSATAGTRDRLHRDRMHLRRHDSTASQADLGHHRAQLAARAGSEARIGIAPSVDHPPADSPRAASTRGSSHSPLRLPLTDHSASSFFSDPRPPARPPARPPTLDLRNRPQPSSARASTRPSPASTAATTRKSFFPVDSRGVAVARPYPAAVAEYDDADNDDIDEDPDAFLSAASSPDTDSPPPAGALARRRRSAAASAVARGAPGTTTTAAAGGVTETAKVLLQVHVSLLVFVATSTWSLVGSTASALWRGSGSSGRGRSGPSSSESARRAATADTAVIGGPPLSD